MNFNIYKRVGEGKRTTVIWATMQCVTHGQLIQAGRQESNVIHNTRTCGISYHVPSDDGHDAEGNTKRIIIVLTVISCMGPHVCS